YRGLTGLRPIVLDDASGSPVDPDSRRAPSVPLRPRGRVTARVSTLASSLLARWYGRQSRPAARESPAPLPISTRQAGREGNPTPSRDRQSPARQVWPLARQFSRDASCVPPRSRLEGQPPREHDAVLPSRSQPADRRGGCTRNVSKGLVDGNSLDERSEIIEHIDGSITQPLVILEMADDKDQLWTKLASPPSRHTATDSKRLGLVRGGENHAAADGDRFSAQRRVEQLLDRCIEGIEVRMEDGGCCLHSDRRPRRVRAASQRLPCGQVVGRLLLRGCRACREIAQAWAIVRKVIE